MRSFRCQCGSAVYFENDRCLRCGRALAFDPAVLAVRAVRPDDRLCTNHAALGTCNWLAESADDAFCRACSLNEIVPDLSDQRRVSLYYQVEKAKRRLLCTLFALGLPVEGRATRPDGLSFRILADARLDGGETSAVDDDAVTTGHLDGRITINLLEADPHLRERERMALNEPYRTLLGHFRHEAGHYYWNRLVAGCGLDAFRAVFGDERAPYQESLDAHYRDGPPVDWQERYVGAYASCHPLEDFAECWAHYLHIADALETACHSGVSVAGCRLPNLLGDRQASFADAIAGWRRLATAMNDMNRSLGLADAYPFALPPAVVEKLRYVHELVRQAATPAPQPSAGGQVPVRP